MEVCGIECVAGLAKLGVTGINVPGNRTVKPYDSLIGIEPQRIGSTAAGIDTAANASRIVEQGSQLDAYLHVIVGPVAVTCVNLGVAAAVILDRTIHDRPILRQSEGRIGPALQSPC